MAGAIALAAAGLAVPSLAAPVAPARHGPPLGPVKMTPAAGTPHLAAGKTTPLEQIRQLVQCRNTMYAVGSFSLIQRYKRTYTRHDVFSFSALPPYRMTVFRPKVNGTVDSIAFSGGHCAHAYIGGKFTSVDGKAAKNIAEVSTSTSGLVSAFRHSANGEVETLLGIRRHIVAGGYYTSVNGSSADPYLTSLNSATGKDDGFVSLHISGHYVFSGVSVNPTRVYNQARSHNGRYDLVMGDFTAVGGLSRQQIFMLNIAGTKAAVTGWSSSEWNGGPSSQCATSEPFYIEAAAWSPNDATVYIADTGYHPWNMPIGATPRTGLCDAAAAFPATQTSVLHKWINYTGCDSLYAAAADTRTAYFAGHERWSSNPNDCDAAGAGAISAPGIEGLSPTTGKLAFNPTRARGLGADDMLVTSAGLWIASDNYRQSQDCGQVAHKPVSGHAGLCFLPYS